MSYIFLSIIFSILPIFIFNKKDITFKKIEFIFYLIIISILNYILPTIIFNNINYLYLTIGLIIGLIMNILLFTKKINFKQFKKFIIVYFLFNFISIFVLIGFSLFGFNIKNLSMKDEMLITCISDIILLILLIYFYKDDLKNDFNRFKKNFYKYMDTGFKYYFIGLITMMLSNIIISLLIPTAKTVNEETVQSMIKSSNFIISIITIAFVGPINEELVFRKSVKDLINNKKIFIIASGVFFGATHIIFSMNSIFDLFYIIPYSSLGIALAKAYCETDTIYTSILLHITHNFVLTLLSISSLGVIL